MPFLMVMDAIDGALRPFSIFPDGGGFLRRSVLGSAFGGLFLLMLRFIELSNNTHCLGNGGNTHRERGRQRIGQGYEVYPVNQVIAS